jgi:hypothetical protein
MGQAPLVQMGKGKLRDLAIVGQDSGKGHGYQRAAQIKDRQAGRLEGCRLLACGDAGQDAVAVPIAQPSRRQHFQAVWLKVQGPAAAVFGVVTGYTL